MKYYYEKEVRHSGLNKYRIVKAASSYELDQKVRAIKAQWDEQWERKCSTENKRIERENRIKNNEESLDYANEMTEQAEELQEALDSILSNSLEPIPLDEKSMKDFSSYPIKAPSSPIKPDFRIEPKRADEKYNPQAPLLTKLFKKKFEQFNAQNEDNFQKDLVDWNEEKKQFEENFAKSMIKYNEKHAKWNKDKEDFLKEQFQKNGEVDHFIQCYNNGETDAVVEYYSLVLENIKLPFEYDKQVELDLNSENKMLLIDLLLPTIDDIPNLKKVAYIKSKSEFKETYHTEAYMKKKYDSIIYQIVLQTLNYIFSLDSLHNFIDSVVLNGKIKTIDKSTGKDIEPYILSINIAKKDFIELNLSAIDAKAWFKSAKGISAATFADVTPVAPIVSMSRDDSRFIDGYNVVDTLDNSINLAAIDWQDFENLIRELFEQEFNANGGEVRITQASRDGGVDAIAFDPDPIRGGKIVIQAKRYTNVVGVSAVRDLYGTVMNEGATKGILVTTSDYGTDSYNFAKGKPLTLLNGANLLSLLEKHGHQAKINIKEAKQLLNQ
ncbi:restriction endonuclease [Lacrimispora sp.]|uniref:restriction endonuclease n=1 Tax=Lacrimispora sp. TaxID=2719234 RepID=UPI00289CA97E|nr:restriction endonuclease [Lacrimispora sp.]